jgi:hypothetical protein
MAKSEGSGFEWDTLWSAWRGQPIEIKRQWMSGENGLAKALKEIMERYTKAVQDEVFGFAPEDIQKYFGYVDKEAREAKAKQKSGHNTEYRSALLDKIRGIQA